MKMWMEKFFLFLGLFCGHCPSVSMDAKDTDKRQIDSFLSSSELLEEMVTLPTKNAIRKPSGLLEQVNTFIEYSGPEEFGGSERIEITARPPGNSLSTFNTITNEPLEIFDDSSTFPPLDISLVETFLTQPHVQSSSEKTQQVRPQPLKERKPTIIFGGFGKPVLVKSNPSKKNHQMRIEPVGKEPFLNHQVTFFHEEESDPFSITPKPEPLQNSQILSPVKESSGLLDSVAQGSVDYDLIATSQGNDFIQEQEVEQETTQEIIRDINEFSFPRLIPKIRKPVLTVRPFAHQQIIIHQAPPQKVSLQLPDSLHKNQFKGVQNAENSIHFHVPKQEVENDFQQQLPNQNNFGGIKNQVHGSKGKFQMGNGQNGNDKGKKLQSTSSSQWEFQPRPQQQIQQSQRPQQGQPQVQHFPPLQQQFQQQLNNLKQQLKPQQVNQPFSLQNQQQKLRLIQQQKQQHSLNNNFPNQNQQNSNWNNNNEQSNKNIKAQKQQKQPHQQSQNFNPQSNGNHKVNFNQHVNNNHQSANHQQNLQGNNQQTNQHNQNNNHQHQSNHNQNTNHLQLNSNQNLNHQVNNNNNNNQNSNQHQLNSNQNINHQNQFNNNQNSNQHQLNGNQNVNHQNQFNNNNNQNSNHFPNHLNNNNQNANHHFNNQNNNQQQLNQQSNNNQHNNNQQQNNIKHQQHNNNQHQNNINHQKHNNNNQQNQQFNHQHNNNNQQFNQQNNNNNNQQNHHFNQQHNNNNQQNHQFNQQHNNNNQQNNNNNQQNQQINQQHNNNKQKPNNQNSMTSTIDVSPKTATLVFDSRPFTIIQHTVQPIHETIVSGVSVLDEQGVSVLDDQPQTQFTQELHIINDLPPEDENTNKPTADDPDGDGIIGIAGTHYPSFAHIFHTSFQCNDKPILPGTYADMEARCQMYHSCGWDGSKTSFLCSPGTVFNQKYLICDWWYNVNCNDSPNFYSINTRFSAVANNNDQNFLEQSNNNVQGGNGEQSNNNVQRGNGEQSFLEQSNNNVQGGNDLSVSSSQMSIVNEEINQPINNGQTEPPQLPLEFFPSAFSNPQQFSPLP